MSKVDKSDPFPTLPRRQLFRDAPVQPLPVPDPVDRQMAEANEVMDSMPFVTPWAAAGISKATWYRRQAGLRKAVDEVE